MNKPLTLNRTYPFERSFGGQAITFRLMTSKDRARILKLAGKLHHEDLLFLRMDITQKAVVDTWCENIKLGRTITVLAENAKNEAIGYGTVHHDELLWTRHLGEMRLLVAPDYRSCGLGKVLATELAQIAGAQHLQRLVVHIPRDKPHVQHMLIRLGFNAEALLTDWLMDREGKLHDMLVMSRWLHES